MKNMERESFEDSWKNAFERAEITPSENVWTNVELDLEKARGGELKRRLLFYKMLAAACVAFAMAVAGVGYYHSFVPGQPEILADDQSVSTDNTISGDSFANGNEEASASALDLKTTPQKANITEAQPKSSPVNRAKAGSSTNQSQIARRQADQQQSHNNESEKFGNTNAEGALASIDIQANQERSFFAVEKPLSPLYTPREIRLDFSKDETAEVDPVVAMLAKLERREKEVQSDKKREKKSASRDENLWTSIGFAAGSFNAMQSSSSGSVQTAGNTAYAMAAAPIVDQETKASGYSYTMGVNVGTKLSGRWVLQGGVNYLTHSSEYTANNVVMQPMGKLQVHQFRAASTIELVNADESDLSNKIVYSAPYSVNNSMRYLSIPMQAGYLLVNKTFGLQLNAGVATDLFLQNTVKAESNQLATTSQPSGSDSPYRAVNLSGLFGTEFSYRFGPHYRVSLNPGLRYPFNTIYKSELGVQSTPLTFDVGLRFRYIFH